MTDISARVHHPTADWQAALGITAPIATGLHYDSHGAVQQDDRDRSDQPTDQIDQVAGASQHVSNHD